MEEPACMALCNSLGPAWAIAVSVVSLLVAELQRRRAKRLLKENRVLRDSLRPGKL